MLFRSPTFEPRAQQPLIVLARPCSTVSPRVNSPAGAICTELASDDQSAWLSSTRRVGQSISARLVTQLLSYSALVGGALIVAAAGLGWWLAGRSLRPVHRMAAAARRLATRNPHGRIPLHGPRDELRDLGETFNSLLDRLGAAFASQQRFAANAAHELRTPLTIQRATIQIGLEDVTIGPVELASIKEELLATNRRQEQLIDRLLTFARSDAGLDVIEPVDVRDLVRDSVNTLLPEARGRGVRVHTRIATIPTEGDPVLLRQLVTNLVQNAIRHNHEGGTVTVRTSGERRLTVINTGPEVAPEKITELFEPFHRLGKTRTESATGTGLGLSIVQSIAAAHNATLRVESNRNGGGLTITVTFPEPSGSDQLKHTELVATPS